MSTIAATRSAADAARLPLMLAELRLPTMKRMWADLADQSNREGWPAERFLGALLEQEVNERETRRLYGVLDTQLAKTGAHVAGDDYGIADIAIFPWIMTHKAQGLTLDDWPHIQRWFATVRARDAVQRGLAVGKELRKDMGNSAGMDAETRKNLFGAPATPASPGESQP